MPDSICWLLNLRGADVPRNPVLHALAILQTDGQVTLFADEAKFDDAARAHLGAQVALQRAVARLRRIGPVRAQPTGSTTDHAWRCRQPRPGVDQAGAAEFAQRLHQAFEQSGVRVLAV